ncbi:amidohydrolase [Desulfovibrio ferrophilus]|uniref:5-methylthioadenosine/S-adenosylhomocysteine deaminase n=1 Tax=Desulfovibrio ferrophilus TaxID=241368 RepID=A0A2Z6AWK4_9BACT|nr:amidohydrolase [Desulfovibrio ferrophilus]BBD07600.1 5-methylthioadenosine/S-adenosylhomocysteine deaminase [Desulfovibrio ferrophilus]
MQTPSPCDLLIRAGVLITQDENRSVLSDGGLAIIDGIIVASGPWAEVASAYSASRTLDLSCRLVLPGLVNTHTHAAMTAFRGLADDLPLMEWLTDHIWPVENRLSPEIVYAGTLLACAEMLATGTTCFGDMYLFEPEAARAVERLGMRAVLGEGVLSFPTRAYETPQQAFEHIEAFTHATRDSTLVRTAVAPHAVYTTSPEILQDSYALAKRLDLPWMIHAAESATETTQCLEHFGKRPVPYLADLGLLTPRSLLVHMVDIDENDIDLVAKAGAGVSHNPRSNMKLANGFCPAQKFMDAGVPVSLGTDGAGSNNSLNMFAEMNAMALLQKAHRMDPTVTKAADVLDAATLTGARALGWPELGSLAPGSPADLTALDLDHPGLAPLYEPISHSVYAATGAEVRMTMVAGEIVYEDGQFPSLPQDELNGLATTLRQWALARNQ